MGTQAWPASQSLLFLRKEGSPLPSHPEELPLGLQVLWALLDLSLESDEEGLVRPPEPVSRCNPESPPRLPEPLCGGESPLGPSEPLPSRPTGLPTSRDEKRHIDDLRDLMHLSYWNVKVLCTSIFRQGNRQGMHRHQDLALQKTSQ